MGGRNLTCCGPESCMRVEENDAVRVGWSLVRGQLTAPNLRVTHKILEIIKHFLGKAPLTIWALSDAQDRLNKAT
jgi:hypothetical protein